MNLLPKIKRCPHCETLNFIRINGIIYENEFQTLKDWTLKNKILCFYFIKKKYMIKYSLNKRNDTEDIKGYLLNIRYIFIT